MPTRHGDRRSLEMVSSVPTHTNPHIRMAALYAAANTTWATEGREACWRAYRRLGWQTGRYMIERGLVEPEANADEYGLLSEEIMEICGFAGYTVLEASPNVHRVQVPRCEDYVAHLAELEAPGDFCTMTFQWDDGCLDVISPALEIGPSRCRHRGESGCEFLIQNQGAPRAERATNAEPPDHVAGAPDWTNPQVGVYTLITAIAQQFGGEGIDQARKALRKLGVACGEYLIARGVVSRNAGIDECAELWPQLLELTGYLEYEVAIDPGSTVTFTLLRHPYLEHFRHFDAPPHVVDIGLEWDRGVLDSLPSGLTIDHSRNRWRGDSTDEFVIRKI